MKKLQRWREIWDALDKVVMIGVLVLTLLLLSLGLLRYSGYNASMFDIGNMAQAIWSGTQGRPLEFTYEQGNLSRLALHVELIYWLFVPLYALWSDPRLLLVVQAVGFAAGAWPVYRLARRRLDSRGLARAITFMYLAYPVAQTALLFDFHGDTLAMPCLLFALEAADRKTWRSYAVWSGLALACKFYIAVPLAVLGLVLWLEGERRVGALTVGAACAGALLALGWIRPAFAPPQAAKSHATFLSYLRFYFGGAGPALLDTLIPRFLTAWVVFFPGLWLGRYAWRWILPAGALAIPALLSLGDVAAYDYRFHHYAATVPFLIVATVYGAAELRRRQTSRHYRRPWQGEVWLALAITAVFTIGLVDIPFNPLFWSGLPGRGLSEWRYGQTARDRFKDRWLLAQVPPGSALAASEFLAPHLTQRTTLYLVRYPDELKELGQPDHPHQSRYLLQHPEALSQLLLARHLDEVDYVVADALYDYAFPFDEGLQIGGILQDAPGIALLLQRPDWSLLAAQDGLLLFGRVSSIAPLTMTATMTPAATPPVFQARFGSSVGLLEGTIRPLDGRRFLVDCRWMALEPLTALPPLVAVSRLEGVSHSRMVHLPTLVLLPTVLWEPGAAIHESFVMTLPPETPPGTYPVYVGWYDSAYLHAAATDARSRVGDEVLLGVVHAP